MGMLLKEYEYWFGFFSFSAIMIESLWRRIDEDS
jgi:hypothetical protein